MIAQEKCFFFFLQLVCLKQDLNKVHILHLVNKYLKFLLITYSPPTLPFIVIYLLEKMDHLASKTFYILDFPDYHGII